MGFALLTIAALVLVGAGILWRSDSGKKSSLQPGAQPVQPQPMPPAQPSTGYAAEPVRQPLMGPSAQPVQGLLQPAPQQPESRSKTTFARAGAPRPSTAARTGKAVQTGKAVKAGALGKVAKAGGLGKVTRARKSRKAAAAGDAGERAIQSGKMSARERQAWADANGFTYSREDPFLNDEWSRGAAASGQPVRHVLTGSRFGHETRIGDIGKVTVIGMGTGMRSPVVVDMRKAVDAPVVDLVEVTDVEGFAVLASDAGPVERMLDLRVSTALELLPPQVSAVWFEGEWVIAQLAGPCEWNAVFPPLASLADAARMLPPERWPRLDLSRLGVASREMGEPEAFDVVEVEEAGPQVPQRPAVVRPEEPLELPTRTTGGMRGAVEKRAVGGDEVAPIATGEEAPWPNDGTRVIRRPVPPSIFDDMVGQYRTEQRGGSARDYPEQL